MIVPAPIPASAGVPGAVSILTTGHTGPAAAAALIYAIASALVLVLMRRRPALRRLDWPLGTLLLSCGFTDAAAVWTIAQPLGPVAEFLRLALALASLATVAALVAATPRIRVVRSVVGSRPATLAAPAAAPGAPTPAGDGIGSQHAFADALPQLVWILDNALNVRYVNERWRA